MPKDIAAILEIQDGKVTRLSWEALGAAQQLADILGTSIVAVVAGSGSETAAAEVAAHNVRLVFEIVSSVLGKYTPDGYCSVLADGLAKLDVSHVFLPHSYQVREFAPKLATRMGHPLLSDCTGLRKESEHLVFSRQLYQGKLVADVVFEGSGPHFISVQAGSFPSGHPRAEQSVAPVERMELTGQDRAIRTRPLERVQEARRTVDLSQAEIIVAVGRGIKEAENLPLAEKLAQALGGQLAGSRPICDSGWLPMERQVGSSGQTVTPKLYFAIGISGAIQHLVGMKGSRKIVAINKDPNAPIFDIADIGIVANLFDVIPAITEEITRFRRV